MAAACSHGTQTTYIEQPSTVSLTVSSCKLDYVNPDPLLRLVGPLNSTPVILEGEPIPALLDSGSQISSCTEELAHHLQLDIQPLTGLALRGVGSSSIPYIGYVEAHLQLPDPVNWEGDIVLLVLPCDDTPCILSTRVLQQVQADVPIEKWQASPQWNHVITATLLSDVLSSELDSASSNVILCAKVTLKPGSAVTLHGQLQRHEPHVCMFLPVILSHCPQVHLYSLCHQQWMRPLQWYGLLHR